MKTGIKLVMGAVLGWALLLLFRVIMDRRIAHKAEKRVVLNRFEAWYLLCELKRRKIPHIVERRPA